MKPNLPAIFLAFARLGATAFGGPAAHIAMMEAEFVRKRNWLSQQRFHELLGAANLVPGPTSTELALLLGMERAGWPGLLAAGFGFILPAFVMVLAIAAFVVHNGATPGFNRILHGVQPVLIAVVLQALIALARTIFKKRFLYVCALFAAIGAYFELNILILLIGAGLAHVLYIKMGSPAATLAFFGALLYGGRRLKELESPAASVTSHAASVLAGMAGLSGAWPILLIFLKIGAVFYGGGYVLLAFLREDFVVRLKWLDEAQLMTAIAVGQFTPGPLFSAATFIGYLLQGIPGAVAATVGIFAPAFVYAYLAGLFAPRLKNAPGVRDFLDGVNAASCALMAAVSLQFGRHAIGDWKTASIAGLSFAILLRYKINPAWLVLAGAGAGWMWL